MAVTLSVIICSYNGAARLPAMFEALAAQQVPAAIAWDVLVVDNGSTDGTRAVAEAAEKMFTVPFRVITESHPGKAYALRTAFTMVRGKYFCIVDDDNLLDADYLANAVAFMEAHDDVALIAGRIIPQFEEPAKKPHDFDLRFARLLACRDHGDDVQLGVSPVGAGMVGRTKLMHGVYEQIGTRLMDRVAAGGGDVGEDLEKECILRRLGWQMAYVPTLRLLHVIPTKRLQNEYIDKLLFAGMHVSPWLRIAAGVKPHRSWLGYQLAALPDDLRVMKYRLLRLLPSKLHPKLAKATYWIPFYSARARGYRVLARDHKAVAAMVDRIDHAAADLRPKLPKSAAQAIATESPTDLALSPS